MLRLASLALLLVLLAGCAGKSQEERDGELWDLIGRATPEVRMQLLREQILIGAPYEHLVRIMAGMTDSERRQVLAEPDVLRVLERRPPALSAPPAAPAPPSPQTFCYSMPPTGMSWCMGS